MEKTNKVSQSVRAAFVLLGVFAIVCGAKLLNPAIQFLSACTGEAVADYTEFFWVLLGAIIAPITLFVGGFYLIRYSNYLTICLNRSADEQIPYWEFAAYRLAFTFAGILIISWALPRLGQVAMKLTVSNISFSGSRIGSALNVLLWLIVQCAIGVYLIIGAPHIIKWQTKRPSQTLEV